MSAISAPANVLVLAPTHDDRGEAVCIDLLTPSPPDRENVLWVTLTDSPDGRLGVWREHLGDVLPADLRFVDVGEGTRSAATRSSVGVEELVVETVSSPRDLTTLGVRITNVIADWDDDAQGVLCFDSLTSLLQYVDLEQAFQFMHVLTQTVRSAGGLAHYHMDPGAHDEQALNTIKTLVDDVVEPDEYGAATDTSDEGPSRDGLRANGREDEPVEHRTSIDDGESPSTAVVRAVAAVEGIDPTEEDLPLYDQLDPDALDALLSHSAGSDVSEVSVDFRLGDYRVRIDDETVTVREVPHESDE